LAVWATGNPLIRSTWRWHFDIYDMSLEKMHSVRLNQGVYCERRSVLALAPTAVAAVNDEWSRFHPEAHVAAGAATIVYVRLI